MKTSFPLWALPCRRRKKWREMRDAALEVCRLLNLDVEKDGHALYKVFLSLKSCGPERVFWWWEATERVGVGEYEFASSLSRLMRCKKPPLACNSGVGAWRKRSR